MSTAAGQVLSERYRLIRPVGQGAQASVWVAEHLALGTQVAVKLIDPELAKQEDARERFRREATAAAQLRSTHVVQILDHGIEGEQPFIVMELLEGEDLFDRLASRRRLSLQETSKIVTQVARALTRAHGAGIVHRDLKPENFYLCANEDDEVVKILDFGIAKVGHGKRAAQRTTVGTLMGTPHYMSPEQVKGLREVDHRADLWALGVIVYQCVTGELPFDSEGVGDLLIKISLGEIPVPSRVNPELPPSFDAWFARACDREPGRRFSSARDLAESLARIAELSAETASSPSSPRPPPMPPRASPTRPPAAPPRPATGSTIPKAPPLPRMADPAGAASTRAFERRPSEHATDTAAAPLSVRPSARVPARPSERPPTPPRLTERPPLSERSPLSARPGERPPPAPPRLTERPAPAPPRLTERPPPAPPRATERPQASPLAQVSEQPPASSHRSERPPRSERSPLSPRRGDRPPAPPRSDSASQRPPLSTGTPRSTGTPLSAPPGNTSPAVADGVEAPSGSPPALARSETPREAADSAPSLVDVDIEEFEEDPIDTDVDEPWMAPAVASALGPRADATPASGEPAPQATAEPAAHASAEPAAHASAEPAAAHAPAEPAMPAHESGVPLAPSAPAEPAMPAHESGVPLAPSAPAEPPLAAQTPRALSPQEAHPTAHEREAPPSHELPEQPRDGAGRAAVGEAAAVASAPPASLRAPRSLEQPVAPAAAPPDRAVPSGQTPEHWMKASSVSGLAHEGELPEFDPGSHRRRRVRWTAIVLVAVAGVVAWQVLRSQRLPQSTPAAESETPPPAVATEPAPPQEPAPQPSATAPAASAAPTAQPSASATATAPPRKRRPPPPPKKPRKEPAKVDDLTIEIPTPPPEPSDEERTSPAESPPPAASPPQEEPAPQAE
ncbi:protein kinase domain-containing protein [Sorangium sp. So ce362]|uniref:serine/threonine-protein kinase n=1 Tax=Sorangium sp. So ce362 TaxID=3133303 RepID=UPI003F623B82